MKLLTSKMFLAVLSVCSLGTICNAQSYRIVADVPFAFHANGTDQTPGQYVVEVAGASRVQYLRNAGTGRSIALTGGNSSEINTGRPRLVFHRYGNECFLAEIWNNQGTGTKLKTQKLEQRIRETSSTAMVSEVSYALLASR